MHNEKIIPYLGTQDPFWKNNIETDPFGSYTGVADEPDSVPVQDADDL